MVEFVQRFHAVHGTDHAGRAINHAFTTTSAVNAPQDSLRASVVELTAAVAALTANQKLRNQKSLQAPPQPPRLLKQTPDRGRTAQRWRDVESQQRRGVRCFNCNQFGHLHDLVHGRHSAACVLVGATVKTSVRTIMCLMDQQTVNICLLQAL